MLPLDLFDPVQWDGVDVPPRRWLAGTRISLQAGYRPPSGSERWPAVEAWLIGALRSHCECDFELRFS
jgi:hypothetical protein